MPSSSSRPLVVAIDGPAGSGKSTVARLVAARLGLRHVDTGAMYRALTWKALEAGVDPTSAEDLAALARTIEVSFGPAGVVVDGRPSERRIRSRPVSAAVSAVSAHPAVRRELVGKQQEMIDGVDSVVEGRDIGTVVCPNAQVKVFLTASSRERARRRHRELTEAGSAVDLGTLSEEIQRRDALDSGRTASPLKVASDATVIDSTGRSVREIVDEVVELVRKTGRVP